MSGRGATAAIVLAALGAAVAAPAAQAAPRACPPGRLTVVVDGTRSCKAPSAGRAIRPTSSLHAQVVGALLGDPLIAMPQPRLGKGKRLPPVVAPALAAAARRGFARAEASAIAAAEALAEKPAARRLPLASPAWLAVPVTVVGTPTVSGSVAIDPATGTGSATIGVDVTATQGASSVTVGVDLEMGLTAGDGATLGARIRTVVDDGSGLRKSKAGSALITMARGAACPDATGRIDWKTTSRASSTEGQQVRAGPVNLGRATTTYSSTTRIAATGQMDASATLQSISYTVSVDVDYSHSGQALAFFQARARVKGKGIATGRLDPATGLPLGGATMSVTTSATGDDTGEVRAQLARDAQEALRTLLGDVHKQMKEAEANARAGKCTKITFNPGSPADLDPGQTRAVAASLALQSGGQVRSVRWTATAAKGSVAPASSAEDEASFSVTGAAPGPDTAAVTVRAVSPAGISEAVWTGRERLPEVLIVSINGRQTAPGDTLIYAWTGTARLVRSPDRSTAAHAAWTVDSLVIASYTATIPSDCTGTATYSGSPSTRGGSFDLVDEGAGKRGYRLNIAWTSPTIVPMVFSGDGCSDPVPPPIDFQPAATAPTNDLLPLPTTTTRPFTGFTFDDTFTATDTGWTYVTTIHVAPE